MISKQKRAEYMQSQIERSLITFFKPYLDEALKAVVYQEQEEYLGNFLSIKKSSNIGLHTTHYCLILNPFRLSVSFEFPDNAKDTEQKPPSLGFIEE